jgi:nucleoid DNA-binding protein
MRKNDLAVRLARASGITRAKAADQIDSVVHRVLRNLRQGRPASLPGLGVLRPAKRAALRFEFTSRGKERRGGSGEVEELHDRGE